MQIDITGHQMEVTDALKARAADAAGKLERHTHMAIDHAHFVLEVRRQTHRCGVSVSVGSDKITASEEGDNMYTAIDRAVDKVRRRLEEEKSREKESRRR